MTLRMIDETTKQLIHEGWQMGRLSELRSHIAHHEAEGRSVAIIRTYNAPEGMPTTEAVLYSTTAERASGELTADEMCTVRAVVKLEIDATQRRIDASPEGEAGLQYDINRLAELQGVYAKLRAHMEKSFVAKPY